MNPTRPPLRVLQIITRLIVGGAQETVMYAAELMDGARFRVEVLSGPQTGSEGSLIEEVRQRGVPLTLMPELLRQVSPLNDLRALWKLAAFIRRGHYDVVHTNSSKAGIVGRLAARLGGARVVVHTVHGWSFHEYMRPAVRRTYILLEKLAAPLSDALVVVTRKDTAKGLAHGIGRPEQYHLVRSAIPLAEFDPGLHDPQAARRSLGLPPGVPVLGNVGRFSQQKNPLAWVEVAGRVGQALPECRFLLVGDGPLRAQVEAALREAGIYERTTLTGLRRDVPAMLAAMDVFLLTSLWEGLPRVIPQAMAMRLPLVATQADGTAEAVTHGQTGYLCPPGNPQQMAALCVRLLEDPGLRQAMGQRGRAYAIQEFDVQQMAAQLGRLYEELLQRKES